MYRDYGDQFEHFDAHSFFDGLFQNDPFFQQYFGRSSFANDAFGGSTFVGGGAGDPFASFFGGGGDAVFSSSYSTFGSGAIGANVTSQSISTSYVNGKKVTTKTTNKNGQTIVEKYENDELVHQMIDGEEQQLEGFDTNWEAIPYGSDGATGSTLHSSDRISSEESTRWNCPESRDLIFIDEVNGNDTDKRFESIPDSEGFNPTPSVPSAHTKKQSKKQKKSIAVQSRLLQQRRKQRKEEQDSPFTGCCLFWKFWHKSHRTSSGITEEARLGL